MSKIEKLRLTNFRNYKLKTFEFDKSLTLLVGENASGKTNMMEAIWMLIVGKSFRATRDEEMIKNAQKIARVEGWTNGEMLELVIIKSARQKKRFSVNGVTKKRMNFLGNLRAVLFRPEDLELILGSPSKRREFLDEVLEQVDGEYRRNLGSYKKGLRQRNKLLLKIREKEAEKRQLLFWDQLLIKSGTVVTQKRQELIEFISQAFRRDKISQVIKDLRIVYDRSVISETRFKKYAGREVAAGVTLVGPHRDDLKIILESRIKNQESRDLAVFGSRGEQRLAVLSMKLAELSFITSKVGERPILLLDDIFSELDHEHREDVLEVVGQQQTIMTVTDMHLVDKKFLKKIKLVEL